MEYKAKRVGVPVLRSDRWKRTTGTCSCCDFKMLDMPLSIREWTCPRCGARHDRDRNAAINSARWGAPGLPVEGAYRCAARASTEQVAPAKREEAVGIASQNSGSGWPATYPAPHRRRMA